MRETEFKLSVHASFVVPDLGGTGLAYKLEEGPASDLRSTYYDTDDLRLARAGLTLRYRTGERGSPWTLKLPVEGLDLTVRDEHTFDGSQNSIPESARDLVFAYVRTGSLTQVARLATKRKAWLVRDEEGQTVAEIDDDEVSILEGRRVVARFREVELESKGIDQDGLLRIRDALMVAGAVPTEPIPKAVRALGPRATAEPDIPSPPEIGPESPAAHALQAAIIAGTRRITIHDPPTRLGHVEGLHQMRVGARRLRSDLRTFAPLVDEQWSEGLVTELKWLTGLLGDVRDLDVLQEQLHAATAGLDEDLSEMFSAVSARHAGSRRRLDEGLGSDRYKRLLERLVHACHHASFTELAQQPSAALLPSLVKDPWSKLAKRGRALSPDDADEAFHEVRIKAKKARYAAEAVAPALGKDEGEAARFAKRAAEVQDVLGLHQDAHLARTVFEDLAGRHSEDGRLSFALGRLFERQVRKADEMREMFFDVWSKLDRRKNTRWMDV